MSNYRANFMSGIIGIFGLVGAASTVASAAAGQTGDGEAYRASCRRLAAVASYGWSDVERTMKISCLDAGVIPAPRFERLLHDFTNDCARTVAHRLDHSEGATAPHDVRIPEQELTLMFIRHYDPIFREYCSTNYPGTVLNTHPDLGPTI